MAKRVTGSRLAKWQAWVDERVRYWQSVLGLRDWDVSAHVVPEKQSDNDGELAAWTNFWFNLRRAELYLAADLFVGDAPVSPDEAIVHEMIHWLLWPVTETDDGIKEALLEQAINALARAIVRAGERA